MFLSGFRHRELEGIDFRGLKEHVTVDQFLRRKEIIQRRERTRIRGNLDRHLVTIHQGTAVFKDPHTISVIGSDGAETCLSGEIMMIATGSAPFRPPEFHFTDPRIYDSDSILQLHEVPPTMLVAGGGVIGCEYACMFAELGVQVSIVEKRDRLVAFLDNEIGNALQAAMVSMGITLLTNDSIDKLDYERDRIAVQLCSGKTVAADAILVSSGRVGNTTGLNLEPLGIAVDRRGRIQVNEFYQRRYRIFMLPETLSAARRWPRPQCSRRGWRWFTPSICSICKVSASASLWNLYHSGMFHGGRNRGKPAGKGHRIHRGQGDVRIQCPRPDRRRPGGLPEAHFSPGRHAARRRSYNWRTGHGVGAYWLDGAHVGGGGRSFHQ